MKWTWYHHTQCGGIVMIYTQGVAVVAVVAVVVVGWGSIVDDEIDSDYGCGD